MPIGIGINIGIGTSKGAGVSTPNPFLTNLVEFYRCDEASGQLLGAAFGRHMDDQNTTGAGVGKVGGSRVAAKINSEGFRRNSEAAFQAGDIHLTIAGWFRFASFTLNAMMVGKHTNHGQLSGYEYIFFQTSDSIRFNVTNGTIQGIATWGAVLNPNTYYFCVAQHNPVTNQVSVNVNQGTKVTAAYSGGIQTLNHQFRIADSSVNGAIHGDVECDLVGVWKGATESISDELLNQLYNGGVGFDPFA